MRILLVALGVLLALPAQAYAPNTFSWPRTREQGVTLARMVVSEDHRVIHDRQPDCKKSCGTSGAPTPDAHGIALTVEENAKRMKGVTSFLDVMRRLSPHVTGAKPPARERQQWTSTLPATGKGQPSGWIPERDGNWALYAENWAVFREEMVELWLGGEIKNVVPSPPIAWGTEGDYEKFKEARNLCRLPCDGCVNTFAAKAGAPGCLDEKVVSSPPPKGVLPAALASRGL